MVFYPFVSGWLDALFENNARKSQEKNKQWLDSLNDLFVEKFDEFGFNAITVHSGNYGTHCIVSSRKYPNLYANFVISDEHVDASITWTYYIHEKRWCRFVVSDIQLLSMLGILESPKRKKCWFRRSKQSPPLMSIEQFDWMVQRTLENHGIHIEPYKFLYQDKDCDLTFELDKNTDWFKDNPVRYHCEVDGFNVVTHEFHIDEIQSKLLYFFKNDTSKKVIV
jgi:hypothetical protein